MNTIDINRVEHQIAFHKRSIALWENDLQYPAIKEKAQREIEVHSRIIAALEILLPCEEAQKILAGELPNQF